MDAAIRFGLGVMHKFALGPAWMIRQHDLCVNLC
jgi:hypothetical protein